jgi:hypothetical protein
MIRKLQTGEYRLYSRKVDPKTGKRRNLGTSSRGRQPKSMNAKCNISSGISGKFCRGWQLHHLEPPKNRELDRIQNEGIQNRSHEDAKHDRNR